MFAQHIIPPDQAALLQGISSEVIVVGITSTCLAEPRVASRIGIFMHQEDHQILRTVRASELEMEQNDIAAIEPLTMSTPRSLPELFLWFCVSSFPFIAFLFHSSGRHARLVVNIFVKA